jgi:hypothetical protein
MARVMAFINLPPLVGTASPICGKVILLCFSSFVGFVAQLRGACTVWLFL